MKQIITAIADRLAAEVPELRFIDVDLEQLGNENPPVDFPCALVDVASIDYEGASTQTAEAEINITVGFNVLAPSSHHSAECRDAAMAHYDILDKIAEALHGFEGEGFSRLNRTALRRKSTTYPRHYVVSFRTSYIEVF